ncbi:MAG TPA: hypothetical protein DCS93_11630 [Microscillaceae bacterium]|nr:hypothetical protein [Microscillaceae bacterium]
MKLKLVILSSILFIALGSCHQGVKLPAEIRMSIVEPGHPSYIGSGGFGTYRQNALTPTFKKKLTRFLRRNRVKVEERDFINSLYRLEINKIDDRHTSNTVQRSSGFGCPTYTLDVSEVTVSINITLFKGQTPLERWEFSETCTQRVRSEKIDKDDPDSCERYCTSSMPYYSLNKMIKRCAKQARVVISQKIYDTAF